MKFTLKTLTESFKKSDIHNIVKALGNVAYSNTDKGYGYSMTSEVPFIKNKPYTVVKDLKALKNEISKALRNLTDGERRMTSKNYSIDNLKLDLTIAKLHRRDPSHFWVDYSREKVAEFCLEKETPLKDLPKAIYLGVNVNDDVKTTPVKKDDDVKTTPDKFSDVDVKPLVLETNDKPLGIEAVIHNTVHNAVKSEYTDSMITKLIHDKLNEYGIKPSVKTFEVIAPDKKEPVNLGLTHKTFEDVLTAISAKLNVFLVGEVGSGKTTAGMKAAKALGLEFASMSVSGETSTIDFFGYKDANGKTVTTEFEKFYTNGGVWLIDEIDNGNPNVLAAINQALANDICMFATGMQKKHKDFVCIAAGNTWGHGATEEFVGRNPIDAATLDRFVTIRYDIDEALELSLSTNKSWAKLIQATRLKAKEKSVRLIISPRATFYGEKLLAAGMSEKKALEYLVFKGLSEDEKQLITV